jgi:hypothetical protein
MSSKIEDTKSLISAYEESLKNHELIIKSHKKNIEQLRGILEKEENKDKKILLHHDLCSLTGIIHKNSGKVSIVKKSGDTTLKFESRKPDTFRAIGKMLIKLADLADEKPPTLFIDRPNERFLNTVALFSNNKPNETLHCKKER